MKLRETIMKLVFLVAACCSVLAVALICIFLFLNGVPAIFKIGPLKFFFPVTVRKSFTASANQVLT